MRTLNDSLSNCQEHSRCVVAAVTLLVSHPQGLSESWQSVPLATPTEAVTGSRGWCRAQGWVTRPRSHRVQQWGPGSVRPRTHEQLHWGRIQPSEVPRRGEAVITPFRDEVSEAQRLSIFPDTQPLSRAGVGQIWDTRPCTRPAAPRAPRSPGTRSPTPRNLACACQASPRARSAYALSVALAMSRGIDKDLSTFLGLVIQSDAARGCGERKPV